jgi:hypothetical protein
MRECLNPWLAVPLQADYVLPSDSDAIYKFNAKAREMCKVQLNVLPEPFIGRTGAPVVLLGLNPGFGDRDPAAHARPEFQTLLRNNYNHGRSAFPFYFLDPSLESQGRTWWEKKLKWLLERFKREELAWSILYVEYFPYHSRRFDHASPALPSQEYGFDLVRSAICRGSVVVIMRSRKLWVSKVPELESYPLAFTLKNPQTVTVSSGNFVNCAGFDVVVSAIRDGNVHA